jgi:hypothetical protein
MFTKQMEYMDTVQYILCLCVGIAKCCKENEINVYRKEIKNVYYVGVMYARWSLICLLKGGN